MKITDKEKTEFLLKLAKEHYSQGDDYHAWKSKKDKWHFGHSNDHELQHGQGNNTIIDDSMIEILMSRHLKLGYEKQMFNRLFTIFCVSHS